ncbi:MAG: tetratricopeptide repeat protein [Prevotella sp.]
MRGLKYIFILIALFVSSAAFAQADRQYIRNGNKLFHQQNYAKAEVEYRKAISKNPNNSQAIYNLGNALLMQQKDSAATSLFQKSGKIEKSKIRKAMSYHNIGVICQKHQMYGEAINAYKEALRNNPNDNETRYNLALCKKLLKNQPKDKNKQNNKQKDKNNKDKNKKDKNKDKQNNKNKDQDKQDKKQQQPKDRMSKDNAEQLLNAAMQEEKATQQRISKAMQQAGSRKLQKNW